MTPDRWLKSLVVWLDQHDILPGSADLGEAVAVILLYLIIGLAVWLS